MTFAVSPGPTRADLSFRSFASRWEREPNRNVHGGWPVVPNLNPNFYKFAHHRGVSGIRTHAHDGSVDQMRQQLDGKGRLRRRIACHLHNEWV